MDTDEIFKKNEHQASASVHLSFTNRQKNLFAQLDKAEETVKNKICSNEEPMDTEVPIIPTNKRKRSETKHLRGKESIFKRPEDPLSKCLPLRSAPDHKRNPHKWVKYTLGDVRYEDMTEQSNTAAALSFLRELEQRKSLTADEEDNENNTKIVFKKRIVTPQFNSSAIVKTQIEESDDEKIAFRGSKIVMPEYVVGQKSKTSKKIKIPKEKLNEKANEIKLDHLLEDEED